jgi:hypothetical protein
MDIRAAVAKIAETHPRAVWFVVTFIGGEPDFFHIADFTFSDEVRTVLWSYDAVTASLYDNNGEEVFA